MNPLEDRWEDGAAYEQFMGRWSRRVAERFLDWLDPPPRLAWLEIGCGSGALTSAICRRADPSAIVACDRSEGFAAHARAHVNDPRLEVVVAGAAEPPSREGGFDRIVSGLVLNFVPEPEHAVRRMLTRLRPGGVVSAYVWDYAGRMDFLRIFWEEAVALDAGAAAVDERARFSICAPDALEALFRAAGARDVRAEPIDAQTRFSDFADYWQPFFGGTGPAPGYVLTLEDDARERLRVRLERRLSPGGRSPIDLVARAWAVRGTN